jgi:hypothetical protein
MSMIALVNVVIGIANPVGTAHQFSPVVASMMTERSE